MGTQGKLVLFLGAIAAAALFRSTVFVPPPSGTKSPRTWELSTAACAAALLGAADNAHADAIGDAAGKLSKAAYPFMKEVPWNSYLYSTSPGSKDAVAWAKAVGKMIDMGDRCGCGQALGCCLPIHQGCGLDIGSLLEADPWREPQEGHEGCRQDDRDG